MEFVKVGSSEEGKAALTARLERELADGRVLWLVPGGSNIPVSVAVMAALPDELTRNLTIALTDERYGPYKHPDSNWWQLEEAGFTLKQATRIEVLTTTPLDLQATALRYGEQLLPLLDTHDCIIGQFGMGADGHIAGILPGSQAVETDQPVVGYHTDTFDRITTSFDVIRHCDAGYAFVFGADKTAALQNLTTDVPLAVQPVQILKQIPEAYVYNDQIGGEPS